MNKPAPMDEIKKVIIWNKPNVTATFFEIIYHTYFGVYNVLFLSMRFVLNLWNN